MGVKPTKTNSWQEIKQLSTWAKCKDDPQIYHIIYYQLSKDNRYLGNVPYGGLRIYPRSSSQLSKHMVNDKS